MNTLVDHARRELKLMGEDQESIDKYANVVQAFADMGHSGSTAEIAIPILNQLLQQQNLTPLTEDPDEWRFHANATYGLDGDAWNNGMNGIWQNKRCSEAFSSDHGKTYWLLHENLDKNAPKVMHNSRPRRPR